MGDAVFYDTAHISYLEQLLIEIDRWSVFSTSISLEHSLCRIAANRGYQIAREQANLHVILLHSAVELVTCLSNTVLGTL